ncbi:Dihydrofolate reductase [Buchnera aphidicola (Eriosoma lanigerum)]|uniref:dihydrofolate reductase n=1 Tax=Buchnera aphidicola TaxID=9 RepID=UPI003463D83C
MKISIIAALSQNFVIGKNNQIPWYLPQDLSWFKYHTLHKTIIMGRLTWNSLAVPLPMRNNIVISKTKIKSKTIIWANSISQALLFAKKLNKEVMIIGGGTLYLQTIQYANQLYLTHIHKHIIGDVYFPKYHINLWKRTFYQIMYSTQINNYYSFEILKRK